LPFARYGKSTLLAQAVARAPLPWAWCSCDERMSDRLLVAHLVAGLARYVPGLGAGIEPDADGPEQARALCNEILETVPEELLIVLDDVHALGADASEVLALLVRDLPAAVHLTLAGRSPLPFPLGRIRAGRSLGLGARELTLTPDEAADLLEAAGGRLAPEEFEDVYRMTEGWVTGLLLAAQVGSVAGQPAARPTPELFDYLAEEVFLAQPPALQRFLIDTAVLERFTPALAAAVSGREDAAELCRNLVARHLFTIRLSGEGGWYRYHHLLQAFLRDRLDDDLPERRRALHRAAAEAWLAAGEPLEAVRHHLHAGDPVMIAVRPANSSPGGRADPSSDMPTSLRPRSLPPR
jgi:LuxR family maltose regulon positive regulatory protein